MILRAEFDHDHPARECRAAAGRDAAVAEGMRVGHNRPHAVDGNAELFRRHHRHGHARPGHVSGAERDRHRAVGREVHRSGRFTGLIEPEAAGNAATLAVGHGRPVVVACFGGLQGFDQADAVERFTVNRRMAFGDRILETEVDLVHADLLCHLGDDAFGGEHDLRHAGCAEGSDLRPVRDDLVGNRLDVLDVVTRQNRLRGIRKHRARVGAGLKNEFGIRGDDRAVFLAPHLEARMRCRDRTGGAQHLGAREGHLYRTLRLAREHDRDRFRIEVRLAAETAAELRLLDADLRGIDLEDLGQAIAIRPWGLRAAPEFDLTVIRATRDAGLRLDIALMHRLGVERPLDDDVGFRKSLFRIADRQVVTFDDVRRLFCVWPLQALGTQVIVQDRRAGLHRLDRVDDVRQHLVFDLDQFQRFLGDRLAGRGDGRDRMAFPINLLACHHDAGHVAGASALRDLGKIVARDDGLHAGQFRRLGDIDRV